MKKFLSTVFSIIFLASPLWAETSDLEPRGAVQQLLREIRQIKPESSIDNQKHSQSALSLLNVPEISKKVLGKYWAKRSETEQEKFQTLLGELFVHVAFPSSANFFAELDLVYGKTKKKKTVVDER